MCMLTKVVAMELRHSASLCEDIHGTLNLFMLLARSKMEAMRSSNPRWARGLAWIFSNDTLRSTSNNLALTCISFSLYQSVVLHFSSTSNSLHTLHSWADLSLDGKQYFVVAGLRVQHEDKVMLVPFFIPVEKQEVFQLIDYIATCKQLQSFHGSKVLRILSDQGTGFVNQDFEMHARQRGIHLATSPAHQPQSNGVAERLVGLAKQCTRRLLLAANLPDLYWSYAMRFVAEMLRHKALGFPWHVQKLVCGDPTTRSKPSLRTTRELWED